MNLPDPIIPLHSTVGDLTRREHSQILAAEHIFKSSAGFWTWFASDDLEWHRSSFNQKINIRSRSERDFSLNNSCYPNEFELSYVLNHCRGQLNWTYTGHKHTQEA